MVGTIWLHTVTISYSNLGSILVLLSSLYSGRFLRSPFAISGGAICQNARKLLMAAGDLNPLYSF
jgi:hypothetical protein